MGLCVFRNLDFEEFTHKVHSNCESVERVDTAPTHHTRHPCGSELNGERDVRHGVSCSFFVSYHTFCRKMGKNELARLYLRRHKTQCWYVLACAVGSNGAHRH